MTGQPITPPATIGMLGGGQLGRYALMAARQMGYHTMVLDPSHDAPAAAVADEHLAADYDDESALDRLADRCAVVTTEFENPPADSLRRLAERTVVRPGAEAVAVAQDRLAEKRFFGELGAPVGLYARLEDHDDLNAVANLAGPLVLKTARLGYDGKGQRRVDRLDAVAAAWADLGEVPCIVEQMLPLDAEISVVVARGSSGGSITYPVGANIHVDGVLDVSMVPSGLAPAIEQQAAEITIEAANALGYVGVLAVEFFVVGGSIMVNEMAPRPHNSGHWTLDGARTSQFENQIRAICGLTLGDTALTSPHVAMANLLGDLWQHGDPKWQRAVGADTALHLYGKSAARPGRKMGHLTGWGSDPCGDRLRTLRKSIAPPSST